MKNVFKIFCLLGLFVFATPQPSSATVHLSSAQGHSAHYIEENGNQLSLLIFGSEVQTAEQLHQILASSLGFPHYYGMNLDALFDMLTDSNILSKEVYVIILNRTDLQENLGRDYFKSFVETFRDAEKVMNGQLRFHIQ